MCNSIRNYPSLVNHNNINNVFSCAIFAVVYYNIIVTVVMTLSLPKLRASELVIDVVVTDLYYYYYPLP